MDILYDSFFSTAYLLLSLFPRYVLLGQEIELNNYYVTEFIRLLSCGAILDLKIEALILVSFLLAWYWMLRQFSHLTSFTDDSLFYRFTFFSFF